MSAAENRHHCPAPPAQLHPAPRETAPEWATRASDPSGPARNEAGGPWSEIFIGEALLPQAERLRLERQRAEMAAIVNSSDDAIVGQRLDGTITSWNPGAERMYGYAAEEVVGRSIRLIVPPEREEELAGMLEQLRAGAHLNNVETVRLTKQRHPLNVSLTLSPIQDRRGRTLGIAAIERDTTARKQSEAQLQTLADTLEQRVIQRTAALHLLYDVASAANRAESVDEAICFVLGRLSRYAGWCGAHAYLPVAKQGGALLPGDLCHDRPARRYDRFRQAAARRPVEPGVGLPGRVLQTQLPEWLIDVRDERRLRPDEFAHAPEVQTAAAFPILIGERVAGVLEFLSDKSIEPDANILESMASIGLQLGRVIERKGLERQIAHATVREQRRIGRELHDSVAQQLTGIAMMAETIRQQLQTARTIKAENAALLVEHIKDAQSQVRRLSRGLMPVEVDAGGLMSALNELAESHQRIGGLACGFQCDEPVALRDNATSTHLYRIAQEAMQNILKHARAQAAVIRLEAHDGRVMLSVRDDGVGMSLGTGQELGIGHRIMRYRAGVIGAALEVESSLGHGTTVRCILKQSDEQEKVR